MAANKVFIVEDDAVIARAVACAEGSQQHQHDKHKRIGFL